jgi:hypothetical protein
MITTLSAWDKLFESARVNLVITHHLFVKKGTVVKTVCALSIYSIYTYSVIIQYFTNRKVKKYFCIQTL